MPKNRIPFDPKLPKSFDAAPNETRSKASSTNGGIGPTASQCQMGASRLAA